MYICIVIHAMYRISHKQQSRLPCIIYKYPVISSFIDDFIVKRTNCLQFVHTRY